MDELRAIDVVERIRGYVANVLSDAPSAFPTIESLRQKTNLELKAVCIGTALGIDETLPAGKRKLHSILNPIDSEVVKEAGTPHAPDTAPELNGSLAAFDHYVSGGDEFAFARRLADEPGPTRAAALVRKAFPALKGRKAWDMLARCGYPVPVPSSKNMRLLFRLGLGGTPQSSDAGRNYPAIMQNVARHSGTNVAEVDFLFSIMSGAVTRREIEPICTTKPRCDRCPVSVHCTYYGYNGAPSPSEKRSIKQWSEDDRPREKLLAGHTLSNAELLAIILRTGSGNQSAVDLARALLEKFETLHRLESATADEVARRVKGIGKAKAAEIKAAIELGRRIVSTDSDERDQLPQINDSRDVFDMFRARYKTAVQEEFIVLSLNTKNRILREAVISRGTLNASIVHPREVFHSALREAAAAVIFVHNHPSGDCTPSAEDRALTLRLVEAGKLLGIRVLDHVILGAKQHYSFADEGMLR